MNFVERWCKKTGFEMYEVEKDFMYDLINYTPKYKLALMKDLTAKFYKEGKQRLQGKIANNWKNIFIGSPGKGKSWSALYLYVYQMETMGSKVDIEKHIAFNKTELMTKLSNIIIEYTGEDIESFINSNRLVRIKVSMNLDEDVEFSGKGKFSEKEILFNAEKTLRQAMINFNYCTPTLERHIYDSIIRIFAINFDKEQTIGFLINPETLNPIGVVRFGLPPPNIIAWYEKEKNKFLIKAGKGEFGGGRITLKEDIADKIIKDYYKDFMECRNKRQAMLLIEEVSAGRLSLDEQKDVYEIIVKKRPELDKRRGKNEKYVD